MVIDGDGIRAWTLSVNKVMDLSDGRVLRMKFKAEESIKIQDFMNAGERALFCSMPHPIYSF